MRGRLRLILVLGAAAALGVACSGDKSETQGTTGMQAPGAPDDTTDQGEPSDPGDNQGVSGLDTASAGGSGTIESACLDEVQEAVEVPLDLYIMLDRSGSMTEATAADIPKWDATTAAIRAFIESPDSAELGIGLHYFPELKPGVPEECLSNADCGDAGPCAIPGVCLASPDPMNPLLCSTALDCPLLGDICLTGYCANDPLYACVPGNVCAMDRGPCEPIPGFCVFADSCEPADYADAEVPITLGPERNPALLASLDDTAPIGLTPSNPALTGALDYARSWKADHPEREVAVVFATDGLPSECSTSDMSDVSEVVATAAAGNGGTPPIKTFVIGVFSAGNQATATLILNSIAAAGGTEAAFMVNTSADVAADFLQALAQIRSSAIACEYQLPADEDLDYGRVNLTFDNGVPEDGTDPVTLVNVMNSEGCAAANETGWYYVRETPESEPNQIQVCPGACALFTAAAAGTVQLQIGCETVFH